MFSLDQVEAEPFLVVGWRATGRIECRKLAVHRSLFADIRTIAFEYLELISSSEPRAYDPVSALEVGEEYYKISFEEMPGRQVGDDIQSASLLEQLPNVDALSNASDDEMKEKTLLFYGFSFQQGDGNDWLTLVRKVNPTTFFRAGRYFCTTEAYLKRLEERPTFAFDDSFDLLLHERNLYATSPTALKQLFTEVNLSAVDVEGHVGTFVKTLPETIEMPEKSVETLVALAKRKKSCISRVYGLSARMDEIKLVEEFSLEAFTRAIGDDSVASEIVRDGKISLTTESHAEAFLDAIEGRYFPDVWTKEGRRADRFSKRR